MKEYTEWNYSIEDLEDIVNQKNKISQEYKIIDSKEFRENEIKNSKDPGYKIVEDYEDKIVEIIQELFKHNKDIFYKLDVEIERVSGLASGEIEAMVSFHFDIYTKEPNAEIFTRNLRVTCELKTRYDNNSAFNSEKEEDMKDYKMGVISGLIKRLKEKYEEKYNKVEIGRKRNNIYISLS